MESLLTPKQKRAIQYIATTSNVLLHRNKIGVSSERLKSYLNLKSNKDLESFVEISNIYLKEEVIPAKIIYDDIQEVYIYLQTVEPSVIVERINSKSMLLLILLYYNQQVLKRDYTLASEIQEIVDVTVVENNTSKIKSSLEPLLQYGLIIERELGYKVTKVGDAFFTPILLNRITNIVMERNYSLEVVLEFFKQNVAPRVEEQFGNNFQMEIF